MLPDVVTAREFWIPKPEQAAELECLAAKPRTAVEAELYLPWRQEKLQEHAMRKANKEITKTRVLQEGQDTIGKPGEISPRLHSMKSRNTPQTEGEVASAPAP